MKRIEDLDTNFKLESNIGKDDVKFYDVRQAPFSIHGVIYENGRFRRMPQEIADTVNQGVAVINSNTAGGRVRFKTNSRYVAIVVKMMGIGKMPHFALTGSAGFDLYSGNRYIRTFAPPFNISDGYESVIDFENDDLRDITINFPLYSGVTELYVGVSETADVLAPSDYKIKQPIVYYGSSITQGGCVSRPGNAYQSIVSREFDADFINLGFSGNAKGEDEIAEYIKGLSMTAFVYDYDHNAPSTQHLKDTHERMFKIIRKENPSLPIIIMSRPKYYLTNDEQRRLDVIMETYNNAKQAGDNNVYLLDGKTLMALAENDGTVDNCHPNDLGFASMARALINVLKGIF
ncbi:MAG: hypothetical protein E7562_02295 [Ruminococcaceae bacterium]|nr:hypothetical protein [Oscillospiraceae bacterium]